MLQMNVLEIFIQKDFVVKYKKLIKQRELKNSLYFCIIKLLNIFNIKYILKIDIRSIMKKFKYIINEFFDNIKQIKIDKQKRIQYLEDIKIEIQNPDSQYNKFQLSSNEDYTSVSYVTSIPENYQIAGSDIMKLGKLQEDIRPIMEYLIKLGYGDYFTAPQYFYVDEEDDQQNAVLNEVSCTYIVKWDFQPVLNRYPKFKWQFVAFIGINVLILAAVVSAIVLPIVLL